MKPFLKWAGNKYKIIGRIKALLPKGERLVEPFVGSGAVFLNTNYSKYLVADNNVDLINLYHYLQREEESFIKDCFPYFRPEMNCADRFYEQRHLFNTEQDTRLKSIIFLYLNKHCYNGLCRYNKQGQFNAPFGRYKKPYFPEREMRHFYSNAQSAEIQCNDFRVTLANVGQGDVVYCDPPYVPLSDTANFTEYMAGGFGPDDQIELAKFAEKLAGQGIPVAISNHDTEFIYNAYSNAEIHRFEVQRNISCNGDKRGKAPEVLAVFR